MEAPASIRDSVQSDLAAIEALYPEAFPDEDLVPIVRDLLHAAQDVVSLVATIGPQIAGHVIFSRCSVSGQEMSAALLAPLAVISAWQRRGIGTAIVHAGLQRMEESGVDVVCVLGDPDYYGRLGFTTESSIEPPYSLPSEWSTAWQSIRTGDSAMPTSGKLLVPPQWMNPSLWAP